MSDSCRHTLPYAGLCNIHGSILRGEVCEAVLLQRVRAVAENEDYGRIFAEYGPDAELISVVPLDALTTALDGGDDD